MDPQEQYDARLESATHMSMNFHEAVMKLTEIRKKRGFTREDVALHTGMSVEEIRNFENFMGDISSDLFRIYAISVGAEINIIVKELNV